MGKIDDKFELYRVASIWVNEHKNSDEAVKTASLYRLLSKMDDETDKYIKGLKDNDIITRFLDMNSVKGVIYGGRGDYEAWVVENKNKEL